MSKIGKYVIYCPYGTNTHHYWDTFEEAKKYADNAKYDIFIAYVVSEYTQKVTIKTVVKKVLDFLKNVKPE